MSRIKNGLIIFLCLLLIPVTAVSTAAVKQRFSDLYSGPEPDWSFVNDIPTIEMQLIDPPTSRVIWTVEHNSKLYVWSGYMGTTVGRLWKQWPVQAERNGKALIRINGVRYERELTRIKSGDELTGIANAITEKYPSRTTRDAIEAGDVWLFEAQPVN